MSESVLMRKSLFILILISSCALNTSTDRKPSSFFKNCADGIRKLLDGASGEVEFDNSRRNFMRNAGATAATAAIGPGQLLNVAAKGAEAILPARQAILRKAAKLRNSVSIQGSETYSEALARAAQNSDFSQVGDILLKRASQIQERLGAEEVLKNLPKRVLEEGTQKSRSSILDARIQRALTKSRVSQVRQANEQLIKIREDLIKYLEDSMIHQVKLFSEGSADLATFLHLYDRELVKAYKETLQALKENGADAFELYPRFQTTVDEYLNEFTVVKDEA